MLTVLTVLLAGVWAIMGYPASSDPTPIEGQRVIAQVLPQTDAYHLFFTCAYERTVVELLYDKGRDRFIAVSATVPWRTSEWVVSEMDDLEDLEAPCVDALADAMHGDPVDADLKRTAGLHLQMQSTS